MKVLHNLIFDHLFLILELVAIFSHLAVILQRLGLEQELLQELQQLQTTSYSIEHYSNMKHFFFFALVIAIAFFIAPAEAAQNQTYPGTNCTVGDFNCTCLLFGRMLNATALIYSPSSNDSASPVLNATAQVNDSRKVCVVTFVRNFSSSGDAGSSTVNGYATSNANPQLYSNTFSFDNLQSSGVAVCLGQVVLIEREVPFFLLKISSIPCINSTSNATSSNSTSNTTASSNSTASNTTTNSTYVPESNFIIPLHTVGLQTLWAGLSPQLYYSQFQAIGDPVAFANFTKTVLDYLDTLKTTGSFGCPSSSSSSS